MTQSATDTCAAFGGLDWAEATHDGCLQAAGSATRACVQLAHTPEASDAWGTTRRTRFHGQPVAVCLALTNGPLVFAWRQSDVLLLFPLTPLTLARYRDAFTPSRATEDPTAAALPLERRLTHRDQLPPLNPPRPARRAREPLVAPRRRVVGDHVRSTQRLTRPLNNYCPPVLQGFPDTDPPILCDVLRRWPTRQAAPLARRSTLETCVRDHHGRSADGIDTRRHALNAASPVTLDAGVIAPQALRVQALGHQLRVTLAAIEPVEHASAPRAQRHPDCPRFQALPGAGPVFASQRLVACGAQRHRDASAAEPQRYAGLAPVTARRGQQSWVHGRLQGPTFLRHTCVEWAAASTRHACWAQVSDPPPRDQGKAHQAAVRALAFTWLRLL